MIPFPNKKYSIIYADPPWSYQDKEVKKWRSLARTWSRPAAFKVEMVHVYNRALKNIL